MMTFHHHYFFTIVLLIPLSTVIQSAYVADFCVADRTHQTTVSGYTCKNPTNVTVDDFVFTGLVHDANTTNIDKAATNLGFVQQFPGLNGLGLAIIRADIEPGGAIPLHTHPAASEMVYVVEGSITAGFISGSPANVVYLKKLTKGEVMVFPQGLLHFQVNSGKEHAMGIASFSNSDPGFQLVSSALFGNDFPSFLVEKKCCNSCSASPAVHHCLGAQETKTAADKTEEAEKVSCKGLKSEA